MSAALRKQQERSRYTHAGSKRVEIILDAETLEALTKDQRLYGLTRQEAILAALKRDLNV